MIAAVMLSMKKFCVRVGLFKLIIMDKSPTIFLCLILIIIILFYSRNGFSLYRPKPNPFKDSIGVLHQHYRTLWYRNNKETDFDSCRKYGLIMDSILGIKEVDTVPQK